MTSKTALTKYNVSRRFLIYCSTICNSRSTINTFNKMFYKVRSTIDKVTETIYTSRSTIDTITENFYTFCSTIYTSRTMFYKVRSTFYTSCNLFGQSLILKDKIQATHKKNTLLQAATGNPVGKACKREFFSATQLNSIFFLPRLRVLIFSPTHPLTGQALFLIQSPSKTIHT